LVGDDPASQVYVRNKRRSCQRVGIDSRLIRLPATTSTAELLDVVNGLNADDQVSGILVQLPLPRAVNPLAVLDAIDPRKDVDGFHAENVGLMLQGRPRFLPCTPFGILQVLKRSNLPVEGKQVCIIGRSDIVGKPMAAMLMQKSGPFGKQYANATVTVCHSRTKDLAGIASSADLLIAAIGQPEFVTAGMVRPGATVIDVGINRVEKKLVGDVDYPGVSQVAGAITPVPGGVGPLTVTMLLANTLQAARRKTAS
jgi:methylenetetrahydrofolate dehydrogenase (NADP+)/methenyltetrahydrofolate cyclohydrolase